MRSIFKKLFSIILLVVVLSAQLHFLAPISQVQAAPVTTTWQATYFNNPDLSGTPVLTRTESAIDYDYGLGSPDPAVNTDQFSARWTGTITVPAGTYRFTTVTDDGVRVYVDGALILEDWEDQLAATNTVDIPLGSGAHTVVMEYYDSWWVASARLSIEDVAFGVTVTANEPGVKLVVDGTAQDTPYSLSTSAGSTHTVYAPSPQTTSDGRTVEFSSWSDGGAQEHTYTASPGATLSAAYTTVTGSTLFENGFEEGDTSAYPQPNIDVREGNSLEVVTEHPRTGSYSLKVSTGGIEPTSVLDQLFPKQNTIYTRAYISLPSDYTLESGAVQNFMVLKTDDFRNALWVVLGPDYRLSPVYFNDAGEATYPGGFGPEIPRDGSWHEVQARYTVDTEHGQVELWLDGQKIAHFTDVNTGLADRDDVGVLTWGSYFSTVSNVNTMYFDDFSISPVFIGNSSEGFQTNILVRDLFIPTYAVHAPDGRIFIAQKDGTIRVVENGELLETPLVTIPNVNTYQDRGLNSIALDPDFETNGYLYAAYTHDVDPSDFTGPKASRVIRLTVTGNTASMASAEVILGTEVGTPATPSCDDFALGTDCIPSDARTHSIGQMTFLPDGTLLIANGEGAPDTTVNSQALRAQYLDSLSGKILRINPDGTGVADNPFYTGDPTDNRSKVWAYGFRNPFRFAVKPGTNTIFAGDVGWGSWEELDVVEPGRNYGWPCFEAEEFLLGYSAYSLCTDLLEAGTATPPLHFYPHPPSSAVVGGTFYEGTDYPALYQGAYFWGDYAKNEINTLRVNADNTLIPDSVLSFTQIADGPVQIFSGPNDNIQYVSINTGQLREVEYVRNGFRPVALAAATPTSGSLPLAVQFSSSGSNDPEGGALTYFWNFGDGNSSIEANPAHTFTTAGIYDVRLTVTDPTGLSSSATVRISAGNTAPTPTIVTPEDGDLYKVGDVVSFSGSATDPEDGTVPGTSLSWQIVMHHCEITTNTCHEHPFLDHSGASGTFTAPDHGAGTYFELRLTATDSQGLTETTSRVLDPQETTLTITSDPLRATIAVYDTQIQTPATIRVVANSTPVIFAPSPQTIEDVEYTFTGWSDGGAQSHTLQLGETPATISASFEAQGTTTQKTWNSYDVTLASGSAQATVTDTASSTPATLELYESTNDNGVSQGALLNTFRPGTHPEGFNAVSPYWARIPGTFGEYPYIGKSTAARASSEGLAPTGVFDLQMSPPENEHLIVAAFVIPEDGEYQVSNLAARRVLSWGGTTTLKVFNQAATEIAGVQTNSSAWSTNSTVYDLGTRTAGEKIYFAVDRDGDFVGDATEVAWTVTKLAESTTAVSIDSFTATPATVSAGTSSTLSWTTSNATTVSINNGVGTVPVDGSVSVSPATTTTYTLTASDGTDSVTQPVTVTVTPASTTRTWNSYDIILGASSPQATVMDTSGSVSATLELFESTNDNGVDQSALLNTYRASTHPEGFNAVSSYWVRIPGTFGEYPYIGKSATARAASETNVPTPTGVFDLQMSPPENEHLIVAAFIVPESGTYTVSGLGTRRVLSWGGTTTFRIFNPARSEVTSLQATGLGWATSATSHSLGALSAGDKIYFAVDRDGDFVGDATEVTWTLTKE